ncbi:MAG TPA: ASKHA domain-containing protein, partial [Ruminiclostridium sp.]|nr:ASKHA domain-containing protein [Ruminiclostridium sp.]
IINGAEKTIFCKNNIILMELLRREGIFLDSPCGGNGRCGKCLVKATGQLSVPDNEEIELLGSKIEQGLRLACRARIKGNAVIIISETQQVNNGTEKFSSQNQSSGQYKKPSSRIGIAADIGTTTIAVTFYDLSDGREIGTFSTLNAQREYGADVISRIAACEKTGVENLRSILFESINSEVEGFFKKYSINRDNIMTCVFAGNTVMQHIAAGISPEGMSRFPYKPLSHFGYSILACELGLCVGRNVQIYFSPCVSAFIGGDITAGLLTCGFDKITEPALFIDIGTNGEMALADGKGNIFCTSTAAGPALEGAHIACGTGSIPGAINKAAVQNGTIQYKTMGGVEPIGICGTGIIDCVAALLELGLIDETGAIIKNEQITDKRCFVGNSKVYLNQKDIREVQVAKSAIASGIYSLLDIADTDIKEIKKVLVAGGLGTGMNIKNACRIGLLPYQFENIAESVGNTSLLGAALILLNKDNIKRAEKIKSMCRTVDLSTNQNFSSKFIDNMMFP